MNFSFKSHLLISELKFIAAHVSRRTVMWCVVDGTKLRLYARDGLFTVETMVPLLVEVDGLISFGVSARYMLAAAQANRKPIVDMTLDGVVRLGSWALNAFYGPSPKWIFRENQLTTLATVSRYSLQTVLETAKRFAFTKTPVSESCRRQGFSGCGTPWCESPVRRLRSHVRTCINWTAIQRDTRVVCPNDLCLCDFGDITCDLRGTWRLVFHSGNRCLGVALVR